MQGLSLAFVDVASLAQLRWLSKRYLLWSLDREMTSKFSIDAVVWSQLLSCVLVAGVRLAALGFP